MSEATLFIWGSATPHRYGHRSQEIWLQSIEARASAFGSYASAVAGIVGVGAAIRSGRDRSLPDPLEIVLVALLVSAMWVSSSRASEGGKQATSASIECARTTRGDWLRTERYGNTSDCQRAELAALLVAEHRGSVLEDWKLDRLKQSSRFFALALIALLAAALLLILTPAS